METRQSATFTVTADTTEELAALLRRVADALDPAGRPAAEAEPGSAGSERAEAGAEPDPSGPDLAWWTSHGSAFLTSITDRARTALLFVASRAPRVPVADLAQELGVVPGPQLAGTLASIGAARSRLGAPQEPFRRVRSDYVMDPQLASLLEQLWRHEEAARRTHVGASAAVAVSGRRQEA